MGFNINANVKYFLFNREESSNKNHNQVLKQTNILDSLNLQIVGKVSYVLWLQQLVCCVCLVQIHTSLLLQNCYSLLCLLFCSMTIYECIQMHLTLKILTTFSINLAIASNLLLCELAVLSVCTSSNHISKLRMFCTKPDF